MPKINGNEIRPGNVLEHNDGLWAAVKVDHVKPGKGGAFAQVELRNLRNGSKLNERFRSADKVERVRLEQKDQQFLYEIRWHAGVHGCRELRADRTCLPNCWATGVRSCRMA